MSGKSSRDDGRHLCRCSPGRDCGLFCRLGLDAAGREHPVAASGHCQPCGVCLAADAGRQSELQKYTLDSLNNYRTGLSDVVNNQTRARLGANEAFMQNQANRRDAISPITTFLGNLLGGG
mgnify:CR=1 FL=1